MRAYNSSLGSDIFVKTRLSTASKTLAVVSTILALAGFALSQTTAYKTLKRSPSGRASWSDGTLGGGYVRPDPNYRANRTSDGQPDIQGIWSQTVMGAQLQSSIEALPNDPKVVTRVFDPPDGKIPYQPWARAKRADFFVHYIDPLATCVPTGVPRQMSYIHYQIIQTPGEVLIVTEALQNFRHIPLDGRPHIGNDMKLWMGDSRGHWEGNSLVIDVTNLNDKTFLSIQGDFHSDQLHVTERLTPIDADTIQYEATIEDPVVDEKPWKEAFPLVRSPKNYEIFEEYCGEGNQSVDLQVDAGRKLYPGLADVKRQDRTEMPQLR